MFIDTKVTIFFIIHVYPIIMRLNQIEKKIDFIKLKSQYYYFFYYKKM